MANTKSKFHLSRALLALSVLSVLLGFVHPLESQAIYTASRRLDFSMYAGASTVKPDFGADYKKNILGYVVGGDATFNQGSVGISFEPRYGHISNGAITENAFMANLKAEIALGPGHRIHPYGMVGLGYGTVNTGYHDDSTIYAISSGVDIDFAHHLAAKGEFQYQFWNLGSPHTNFNPNGYTGALIYRFRGVPFRGR